jgi:hypothetical protein
MESSNTLFDLVWSIVAITLGFIGVFFTNWYVAHTKKWAMVFYLKTKFPFYKLQAEHIEKPYMRFFAKLIGAAFMLLGFSTLFDLWQ